MLKLLIIVLCLFVCTDIALSIEPKDLMAYWSFDKDGGKVVADDSGNLHEGKVIDAAWEKAGKFGGAMLFEGTGDFVEVA